MGIVNETLKEISVEHIELHIRATEVCRAGGCLIFKMAEIVG
jgi:hypothetical protein